MPNKKTLTIIGIIILILFPLFFLVYKISGDSNTANEITNVQTKQIDIAALENAVNANPTYGNLINLSNGYINNNMPEKSIEPLKKALELNPNSAIAYSNIGVAYTMMQQYKKGIEACTKAIEIDSSFQLAKNNLKWAVDENNKILIAIQEMEKKPESEKNTTYYINYGLLYLKSENYDKAIEAWDKILIKEPKNSAVLNNMGTAFMMKFQYDDAIMLFKKAVDNDGNDQLAKNNLAWALNEKNKVGTIQNKQ